MKTILICILIGISFVGAQFEKRGYSRNLGSRSNKSSKSGKSEKPELKSVSDIAASSTDFSYLMSLLALTGLLEMLSKADPDGQGYTVFVPMNGLAEIEFPDGDPELIIARDLIKLKRVAYNHIIPGTFTSNQLTDGLELKTKNDGQNLKVKIGDGLVFLNGDVQVIGVHIMASNGAVHFIDKIIWE